MGKKSKWEYFRAIYPRYRKASSAEKTQILEEFCEVCGYNRKYAITKLNGPFPEPNTPAKRHKRGSKYTSQALLILQAIWEASGYPWSVRLKALLPLWLPWAKKHFSLSPPIEQQLLQISARQIDRRFKARKTQLKRRLYGRTKPGTLLKHHIPIKTDSWNVTTPGFTETDLVSHSGNSEKGEFVHSLNLTDIFSTWVEARAVMGKGQIGVLNAMQEIEQAPLNAINDLYQNELGWMMNLFQPSVKLVKKTRLGSKLKRIYDQPTTALDRLLASNSADPAKLEKLKKLRSRLDPFKLSQIIDLKLDRIFKLANPSHSPTPDIQTDDLSPVEKQTLQAISKNFAIPIYIGKHNVPKG